MTCCDRLQNKIENAGLRGVSAVVENRGGEYIFWLHSRGCDAGDVEVIKRTYGDEGLVNYLQPLQIRFCPYCGTNLSEWAEQNPDVANELAEATKQFLS